MAVKVLAIDACSKRELNIPTEEVRGLYLLDANEYNIGDEFFVN